MKGIIDGALIPYPARNIISWIKASMPSSLHICLDCGVTNELSDEFRGRAVCKSCAGRLHLKQKSHQIKARENRDRRLEANRKRAKSVPHPDSIYINPRANQRKLRKTTYGPSSTAKKEVRLATAGIILVAVLTSLSAIGPGTGGGVANGKSFSILPAPPAQSIYPGIHWNETGRPPLAEFRVMSNPGSNYLIKLEDIRSPEMSVGIYVKGGQSLDVTVPSGTYRLLIASGETWRGRQHLFGPRGLTVVSRARNLVELETHGMRATGGMLDLRGRLDGNFPTDRTSRHNF